ncbi:hypothetical protein IV417_06995 [Alphaproteobacteria bacterium KMM 3653]|uniref:histidine kinase n=1 Tax=Harenicola maris TaxID=2841044 RepID=A0AAP2CR99_9RHOB|nr:hypothetical protein [Harenicola maris]
MIYNLVRVRWVLFLVLAWALILTAGSLWQMQARISSVGTETPSAPVWFATGLQIDLLNLERALSDHALGTGDARDVVLRFDILWSRLDTVTKGPIRAEISVLEQEGNPIAQLQQLLAEYETAILGLTDELGGRRTSRSLLEVFDGFNGPMRQITLQVLEDSSQKSTVWRENLLSIARSNVMQSIVLGCAIMVLLIVFGIDGIRSRRDLEEKDALLVDAQEAFVAKSQFMSVINHELRTPLASVKGAVSLINAGAVGEVPEGFRKMLDLAERNCDTLVSLVNDLLDAEKLDAGKMDFDFVKMELEGFIKDEIARHQPYADALGVNIEEARVDAGLAVEVDRKRLGQILSNLLSNAAKFSHSGGVIRVGAEKRDGQAVISVQDFGVGIPEEAQSKLFDRFYQVDSSSEREKGGTGLGLSIVNSIVAAHGGRIWVDSIEGKGSTFYVGLPLVP